MTARNEPPVACTLGGSAYHERLVWIAQLNRDGLRAHRRFALSLELDYATEVRDRVYQMVRQESECCAFLEFVVDESPDHISVTITVPPRASDTAEELLAPFLPQKTIASEPHHGARSS